MSYLRIPRTIQFLLTLVLIEVSLLFLVRLTFWGYFNSPTDPLASATLYQALYLGLKYDLRVALLVILPILCLAWIRPLGLFTPLGKHLWLGYNITLFFGVIFIFSVHFGYFSYLHLPLDATILRFLDNFDTSLNMMWETYPVVWILVGLLAATSLYGWTVYRLYAVFARSNRHHGPQDGGLGSEVPRSRWHTTAIVLAFGFLEIFGLYGKISYYPLRWSDAYFSPHPFAAAVAVNPVLHAYTTFKNKEVQYDKAATEKYYDLMVDYLGIDEPNKTDLQYRRVRQGGEIAKQKPNIVLVYLESFATYKTGLTGNPLQPTPNFDAIARNGIYFKNYYVPHTGTARSVFTGVTGLPDVETNKTSTRNPLIVDQHTVINSFEGYENYYFIGGSASWGNIRGLLSHNIRHLNMYEEGQYTAPRNDVWGISDLNLFEEANKVLREKRDKPFFAIVQTSGNHRPYTIPDDDRGFRYKDLPNDQVTSHGFESTEEFNSFRYMDHSVGHFMEIAKEEAYFDNTIFVFFGDHGIHADAGEHTQKYESLLGIQELRVPFVIYAPKLLPKPREYDTIASEVDILPTIASLASNSYINTTLGRNLFDDRYKDSRYAFTVSHGSGLTIGLLSDQFYFRMHESGSNKTLYRLLSDSPRDNVMNDFPQQAALLEKYCVALFETSRYMRFHNKPVSVLVANGVGPTADISLVH